MSRKQSIAYLCSAAFTLLLLLLGRDAITNLISPSNNVDQVHLSDISKEFKSVPIHANDECIEKPQSFDKGVIRGVTGRLVSDLSPRDLTAYYSKALPSLGWKKSNINNVNNDYKVKFCKGSMSLIVEAQLQGNKTDYYLGVVWTEFTESSAFCSDNVH